MILLRIRSNHRRRNRDRCIHRYKLRYLPVIVPVDNTWLPCKHLFAFRKAVGLPLFCEALVARRWRMDIYADNIDSTMNGAQAGVEEHTPMEHTPIPMTKINIQKPKSQHEKYKRAANVAMTLATIASEGSTERYERKMKSLNEILKIWENGGDITVSRTEEASSSTIWHL